VSGQHAAVLGPHRNAKAEQSSTKKTGDQTHGPAAEQDVIGEGECNPESGACDHKFHFNYSLFGAVANSRRSEIAS
jgi:hypothetical protein